MSKIKIRNFGPIKEGFKDNDGWLDIKKVTLFVGNQGSGKSTVTKLISILSWIEKVLVRGDYNTKWFERKNRFRNQYLAYHRIENYLKKDGNTDITEIEYQGDAFHIKYVDGALIITENQITGYLLPQIMYVPAERNFIANVKTPKALKLTSDSLIEFVTEFDNAKNELKGPISLPINGVEIEYDKLNDTVNIRGTDYKLKLTESSSGFQSIVPLFLVSWYLSNIVKHQSDSSREPMSSDELVRFRNGVTEIWANENFTDEQRRVALSALSSRFNKSAFINIVEEPEQNLFPTSQWQMLKSLLECNNANEGNKLIVTTHSPYLINFLSLAIKAASIYELLGASALNNNNAIGKKLYNVIPANSVINQNDWVIYELSETDGTITRLENCYGLPSDENYLNNKMGEVNEIFAQLLEIQREICQ